MSTTPKRGRPRKPASARRSLRSIRMSDTEWTQIVKEAKESGKPVARYARDKLLGYDAPA